MSFFAESNLLDRGISLPLSSKVNRSADFIAVSLNGIYEISFSS